MEYDVKDGQLYYPILGPLSITNDNKFYFDTQGKKYDKETFKLSMTKFSQSYNEQLKVRKENTIKERIQFLNKRMTISSSSGSGSNFDWVIDINDQEIKPMLKFLIHGFLSTIKHNFHIRMEAVMEFVNMLLFL